jgi:hypothetical protein
VANAKVNYKVLPLPIVQKWARKKLSVVQLREGVKLVRLLKFYPVVPDLEIERCGDGWKLDIEHSSIGQQGWLRAIFWIDDKSKTIYVVHLFWKRITPSRLQIASSRTSESRA